MWEEILGNQQHKRFLQKYITTDSRPHGLLFVGVSGLGKRMLAYAFAESMLCFNNKGNDGCQSCKQFSVGAHPDFVEVKLLEDKKSLLIAQIRELVAGSAFAPVLGKNKIVLIDDADTMTSEASNAILKLLEEPPVGWTIILLATHEERLLPTILSRVVTLRFNPLSEEEVIEAFLQHVDDKEHAKLFAKLSEGSIGMAIKLYEDDALELRQHALTLLMSLPTKIPMNMAVAAVKYLEDRKRLERADVALWLKLTEFMLRDAMLLQNGNKTLYNYDLEFELTKVSANSSCFGLEQTLLAVEHANRELELNVGKKQILEDLILEMNDCLRRK